MSRVLKVENGNYTVKVEAGKDIVLDTSRSSQASGNVYVYGNLIVSGASQQIETEDLYIKDRIITLNAGQTGTGITGNIAGIEIDRGTLKSYFLFDETISWIQGPVGPINGAFTFETDGATIPIKTNGIISPGNLYLQPADYITVSGTTDYEENVFNYVNGSIVDLGGGIIRNDDDVIPNVKSMIDYVDYAFAQIGPTLISDYDTKIQIFDNTATGQTTRIDVTVDNVLNATFFPNRFEVESIRILDNSISTFESNTDLVLSSPGTGVVKIDDTLLITETPNTDDLQINPIAPNEGIKLYSKTEDTGKTGLFFINKNNTNNEIISNKRALAYSMIF